MYIREREGGGTEREGAGRRGREERLIAAALNTYVCVCVCVCECVSQRED